MVRKFYSILIAIRSLDRLKAVSISYDSKSPNGNINNKSTLEGDKFTQILGLVFQAVHSAIGWFFSYDGRVPEDPYKEGEKNLSTIPTTGMLLSHFKWTMEKTSYACKGEVEVSGEQMQHLVVVLSSHEMNQFLNREVKVRASPVQLVKYYNSKNAVKFGFRLP